MTGTLDVAALAAVAQEDVAAKTALWEQAVGVSSVKFLIPVTLNLQAGNYAPWRRLFEVALQKYALDNHIGESSSSAPDRQWTRLDALVRSWLYGAISLELLTMVIDSSASAYTLWTCIEGLYRDNAETRYIYLKQEFYGVMQGSMCVADYCRKQKALTDELTIVGTPIVNKSLILNTLHGLSPHLAYMRTLLSMQCPVPSFLEMCSALMLEELTMGSESSPLSVFIVNNSKSTSCRTQE